MKEREKPFGTTLECQITKRKFTNEQHIINSDPVAYLIVVYRYFLSKITTRITQCDITLAFLYGCVCVCARSLAERTETMMNGAKKNKIKE